MAIQFHCSKCGALIEVDDHYDGGQCQCPACNATVDVPQGPEAAQDGATPPEPPMPRMSPPTEAGTHLPPQYSGRNVWAVVGQIIVVLLASVVVLGILMPVLYRGRTSGKRVSCASNLKALVTAGLTYAEGNHGFFLSEPSSIRSGSPEEGQACIVGKNGLKSEKELWQVVDGKDVFMGSGSNPRQYFKLLEGGTRAYMQPKQFVCPQAITNVNHRREGAAPEILINGTYRPVHDFSGSNGEKRIGSNCTEMTDFSYSFQVATAGRDPEDPTDVRGGPLTNTRDDPRKALAADRNPYSNEVQNRSELVAGLYGTGTYVYSPNARTGFAPPPTSYSSPKDLMVRGANSRNHKQDGQNVAYLDGHIKWTNNCLAGADEDCIWMTLNRTETGPRIPLAGTNYGRMRSKDTWATDSLLMP